VSYYLRILFTTELRSLRSHRLNILRDKSWRYVTRCFATFLRGSASHIQLKRWST